MFWVKKPGFSLEVNRRLQFQIELREQRIRIFFPAGLQTKSKFLEKKPFSHFCLLSPPSFSAEKRIVEMVGTDWEVFFY